jgi:hypothetical protein
MYIELDVALDNNFTNYVYRRVLLQSGQPFVLSELQENTTYYVRARRVENNQFSEYTYDSFTTSATPTLSGYVFNISTSPRLLFYHEAPITYSNYKRFLDNNNREERDFSYNPIKKQGVFLRKFGISSVYTFEPFIFDFNTMVESRVNSEYDYYPLLVSVPAIYTYPWACPFIIDDDVYMLNTHSNSSLAGFWKVNLTSKIYTKVNNITFLSSAPYEAMDYDYDSEYFYFSEGNNIYRINKNNMTTSPQVLITAGTDHIRGVCYSKSDNKIYYSRLVGGYHKLHRANPDGSNQELLDNANWTVLVLRDNSFYNVRRDAYTMGISPKELHDINAQIFWNNQEIRYHDKVGD